MKNSLLLLVLFLSFSTNAKPFKNSFIKFNLPTNWDCEIQSASWHCSNKLESKEKSAVIVFAAKKAGPQDNLENYVKQIGSKPGVTVNGNQHFKVKKIKIQKTQINGQKWVDGLSFNSEAPEFYTRYLATVKNKTALIVTFTSHKNYYTSIVSDFINAINSIEILNPEESKIVNPTITNFKQDTQTNDLEPIDIKEDINIDRNDTTLFTPTNILFAILALLAFIFVLKK